jgi:hypothetical protein
MVIDLNRASLSDTPLSVAINAAIERAEPLEENTRKYLGASTIGSECMRRVQYDWMVNPVHPLQTRDIFRRGHLLEELSRQHFIRAGFKFAPSEKLSFSAADGLFRGHADGILLAGPELPDVEYPCLWEHKALGDKGWRELERDGIEKAYPQYRAQTLTYMSYLDVTEHPAIFTATNANTMARLHVPVPFDATQAQFWSDRAVTIIEATKHGELLPRAYSDPDDWRCRMCGHHERCWRQPP